jgi:hypothetical protein
MVQENMKPLPPFIAEVKARIERLLATSFATEEQREITFDLDGDVLVMRGTVPTEQERRLAESLLLLEPGVQKVKNELKVPGRAPAPRPAGSGP